MAEAAVPDLIDRELQAAGTRLNLAGALRLAAAADAVGSCRHTRQECRRGWRAHCLIAKLHF